jgi:hypothetical protein
MAVAINDSASLNLLFKVHEPLNILSDIIWVMFVVAYGPFSQLSEYRIIYGIGTICIALNLVRYCNTSRSRRMIEVNGLSGTRGSILREVKHKATLCVIICWDMIELADCM